MKASVDAWVTFIAQNMVKLPSISRHCCAVDGNASRSGLGAAADAFTY